MEMVERAADDREVFPYPLRPICLGHRVLWIGISASRLSYAIWVRGVRYHELALNEAHMAFDRDLFIRRWASEKGRIYVPISPTTLKGMVKERNIRTPLGQKLTLPNPAYLTHQIHDMQAGSKGVLGHITSLKPIRPENKADVWETNALKRFEDGVLEVSNKRTSTENRIFAR